MTHQNCDNEGLFAIFYNLPKAINSVNSVFGNVEADSEGAQFSGSAAKAALPDRIQQAVFLMGRFQSSPQASTSLTSRLKPPTVGPHLPHRRPNAMAAITVWAPTTASTSV